MSLHPYMAFAGDDPTEGAVLVFANNSREAKPLAYCGINSLFDVAYTDIRVRRMRKHLDHLHSLGDADKLARNFAHVVDDPASCPRCESWGAPAHPDGGCMFCHQADAVQP